MRCAKQPILQQKKQPCLISNQCLFHGNLLLYVPLFMILYQLLRTIARTNNQSKQRILRRTFVNFSRLCTNSEQKGVAPCVTSVYYQPRRHCRGLFFIQKKQSPAFRGAFFLFRRRFVCHCSLRVSHTLGSRINHDTEDHQHSEQRIDNEQQLVAKFAQIQVVPEQRSHRLNQQQLRRDQRHPELFVHNTHFPVNHVSHLNSKSRSFLAVRSTTEGRTRTQRRTHHSHPPFSPASVYIFHATL